MKALAEKPYVAASARSSARCSTVNSTRPANTKTSYIYVK